MPTILMLDASLSMTRPVSLSDSGEDYQRRHLAIQAINTFLDHLAGHCKLEFVSLVEFSSIWGQVVPFTRDYSEIRNALAKTEEFLYNKTCIEPALAGASSVIVEEWGTYTPSQIILITDGCVGVGKGSLKHSLQTLHNRDPAAGEEKFPLPYVFPCKIHIACIAANSEACLQTAVPQYEKLISLNGQGGEVFIPDGALTLKNVQNMFTKLSEKYFIPFHGALKCGNLKCNINMYPAPDAYEKDHVFEHVDKSVSRVIEICGFLDTTDIGSPPFISRHLILPMAPSAETDGSKSPKETEEPEESESGKQAAFTVLLHGSLKVEGMVALTQLADDWYGVIYSWADSKKKSNLMLSIFTPGADILPWLGNLSNLAPSDDFLVSPYGEDDNKSPFPVKPADRRSYAQNCVIWIKQAGLQADIQKILRNARKLPEKQQHFYKELNRLRKASLSYGFVDLLDAVAQLLERECTMLPGNAHPDAALQLTHAASVLRSESAREISQNISPMRTNFSAD